MDHTAPFNTSIIIKSPYSIFKTVFAHALVLILTSAAFSQLCFADREPPTKSEIAEEVRLMYDEILHPPKGFLYRRELGLWINHAIHVPRVIDMGPNALCELSTLYTAEDDPEAIRLLGEAFMRLSGFEIYYYTKQREPVYPYDDVCVDKDFATAPALSACEAAYRYNPMRYHLMRDLLLSWWDQRDTFLRRTDVVEKIRTITGTKGDAYSKWGMQAFRQLEKHVRPYGIYNIPYFIQVVLEDNNPIIFWELLKLIHHDVFFTNTKSGFEDIKLVEGLYPSCESKLDLLIKDWEDNKHKYTNLPDLYAAIDAQIKAAKETVDASK